MKIRGLDNLARKLEALGGNTKQTITKSMDDVATFVRDDARIRCPVDTRELRQSINKEVKVDGDHILGNIGTSQDYAIYVEMGTGQKGEATNTYPGIEFRQDWVGQPAQPYMYPALKDNEEQIEKKFVKDMQKEIRRLTV